MELDIKNDNFLEYGEFNGNLYGTKLDTIDSVIRSGKMCVLDVNPTVSFRTREKTKLFDDCLGIFFNVSP